LEKGTINVTIRFAVIGINHNHIFGQVNALLGAGATFAGFFAPEDDLAADFAARYPQAVRLDSSARILDDPNIALVASAGVNADRAALGIEVMRAGKDFMSDKPGMTSLAQLEEVRRVQAETKRIYSIYYSEHFAVRCVVRAGELVRAGAIGTVVNTVGLGPHRIDQASRPGWFFERERYGGILADIASHQIEQFLFFTGAEDAEVAVATVANRANPAHPELQDFGDMLLRTSGVRGYVHATRCYWVPAPAVFQPRGGPSNPKSWHHKKSGAEHSIQRHSSSPTGLSGGLCQAHL
jgi:predicted dehydrogenase